MPGHDTLGLEECLYLTRGSRQAFRGHLLCGRPLTHSISVNHYHSSVEIFNESREAEAQEGEGT